MPITKVEHINRTINDNVETLRRYMTRKYQGINTKVFSSELIINIDTLSLFFSPVLLHLTFIDKLQHIYLLKEFEAKNKYMCIHNKLKKKEISPVIKSIDIWNEGLLEAFMSIILMN